MQICIHFDNFFHQKKFYRKIEIFKPIGTPCNGVKISVISTSKKTWFTTVQNNKRLINTVSLSNKRVKGQQAIKGSLFPLTFSQVFSQNEQFCYPRCLKITEKVSFNIASEASYPYILSGQKFIKNAKNGPFLQVFENLKLAVKQCYQTG